MFFARPACAAGRVSRLSSRSLGLFVCLLSLTATSGAVTSGTQVQFSGTITTLGGGFSSPYGVAVDAKGNVYVADPGSSRGTVTEIPVGCESASCVVSLGGGLNAPNGIAVDASGNVYVTDISATPVKEIPAGCTATNYNNSSCTVTPLGGGFNRPEDVAVDASGNVYVADTLNSAIKKIPVGCTTTNYDNGSCTVSTLGGGFIEPGGVAVDKAGNVYVGDAPAGNAYEIPLSCIEGLNNSGCVKTLGSGFIEPNVVAVDASGNVYVTDEQVSTVMEIPVSCLEGANNSSCEVPLGSGFDGPEGVAVDGSGNVYVADNENSAVKEIMLHGVNFFSSAIHGSPTVLSLPFTFTEGGAIGAPKVVTQGSAGLDFKDAGSGSCTTNGTGHAYNAGDTCTVDVSFAPGHPGVRYGAAELTSTSGVVLATAYVYGTGTGPQITFYSGTQSFLGNGFVYPSEVAVDGAGNVYVADPFNNTGEVNEILAAGGYNTVKSLGSGFDQPAGVAVDGADNVFVADTDNDDVWEMTPGCSSSSCMTKMGGGFDAPRSAAVDGAGNIFIADYGDNQVKEIPAGCTNAEYVSGACTVSVLGGGFLFPQGVAVDGSGDVFVGDTGNGFVKEIPPGCTSATCVQKLAADYSFSGPIGLTVDGGGDVYVADTGNNLVEEIPPGCASAACMQFLGSGFNSPSGVAVDAAGDVFVGDSNNGLVDELNLSTVPAFPFAATAPGQTSSDSPAQAVVSNDGNQTLDLSSVTYPDDFPEAPGVNTDCTSTSTLTAGISCTLTIDFSPQPSSSGALNEAVSLTDNNLNTSPSATQSIDVSGTAALAPSMTNPVPESTLGGSTVTFQWNPGAGSTAFILDVGTTGPGASDIYAGTQTTNTSVTLTNVPTTGANLYVQLAYRAGGKWQDLEFVYTQAGTLSPPSMTSPAPGSTLSGSSATFEWNPGSGATTFKLYVGTTGVGASDVYAGIATTATSVGPLTVPTTGANLYVRLFYVLNGVLKHIDYVYTQAGTLAAPSMVSPTPGSTLSGSSATFQWNPGSGNVAFMLYAGTKGPGSANVYEGAPTAATSVGPLTIPTTGANLYVTLWYELNGAWSSIPYVYTQAGTLAAPSMTSPVPGTTLNSSSVTFQWNPGSGSVSFTLDVGTTGPGASDVYAGASTTASSVGPLTVPTTGASLYVTLWYRVNGKSYSIPYVYTQAGTLAAPSMTSPAPGSTLGSGSVTFQWSPGSGSTEFKLLIGTTSVGADDVYNGKATTADAVGPLTVPTTGANLYVRLLYMVNGVWDHIDYEYIQAGTLAAPSMTSPTPGSTLSGSSVTFQWNPGSGNVAFILYVGTKGPGSANIYEGGSTTASSLGPLTVPTTGANLYVTLWYELNGAWSSIPYVYTQAGTLAAPSMTSPTPGTTLNSSSVTFQWNPGSGNVSFTLDVGTTGPGASDVYAGASTTASSAGPLTVPTTGANLYVTLWYKVNGKSYSIPYVYTQAGTLAAPSMTSPTPGSTLSGSSATFQWNPGSGSLDFKLLVGTTGAGSSDVYAGASSTSTSVNVTNIPTTGSTLYVRLEYLVNGVWKRIDYTYTEFALSVS